WNGNGAARVWLHDRDAVLLERACATPTLGELSAAGHDDDAIRIACDAVARPRDAHAPYHPKRRRHAPAFPPIQRAMLSARDS
ncbi:aminoglycoside phosphotransferase family protein, partial [Cupriavidus sp. SIMBA_020]|uniref:aminoglycoside phosphotransferase family protein n=1 Tax=Cupriavidus sp. SIMBA_020 TaxID=3085766 RepID=UPI00397867A5